MSDSVSLITNPRDQLLTALPFIHTRARNQCHYAIRRAFEVKAGEQESVPAILNLLTRKDPKLMLMSMIANVVRNESEFLVILTGREVECSLETLLQKYNNEGSASASAVAASESNDDTDPNYHGMHEDRFRSVSQEGLTRSYEPDDDESGKISVLESANDGAYYREVPCEALASTRGERGRPTIHLLGSSGGDGTVSSVGSVTGGIDGDASFSVTSSITAPTGATMLSVVSSLSPLSVIGRSASESAQRNKR